MTAPLIFVDTETTGLDPDIHEVYEIALIRGAEAMSWWMPVDLRLAQPDALRISRFYERVPPKMEDPGEVAKTVAEWTAGCHLVGAVPSFDAAFLKRFLFRRGYAPAWHYHLVDVEALAAGKLGIEPPWNSEELYRELGVPDIPDEDRHTALGDARQARDVYQRVFDYTRPQPAILQRVAG